MLQWLLNVLVKFKVCFHYRFFPLLAFTVSVALAFYTVDIEYIQTCYILNISNLVIYIYIYIYIHICTEYINNLL